MARRWSVLLLLLFAAPLVAAPSPKAPPPRGLTDREADRQSPPQPWRGNGWRAVFPHAYAMLRRVQVRATPDVAAPVAFEIPGGMRVPIYEQRGGWWRVGGTKARAGWVRAAEMVPHARCIMLDAKTGRVLRQFATKGQWSVLPRNDALWALADTGLTRVAWDGGPHFWASQAKTGADASILTDAAWSSDERQVAVTVGPRTARADVVSLVDGAHLGIAAAEPGSFIHRFPQSPHWLAPNRAGGDQPTKLLDPFHNRPVEPREGVVLAVSRSGDILSLRSDEGPGGPGEIQRWSRDGKLLARRTVQNSPSTVALTPDERYALLYQPARSNGGGVSAVFDARTLRPVLTLALAGSRRKLGEDFAADALLQQHSGWLTINAHDGPNAGYVTRDWDARGRLRTRRGGYLTWNVSPDGAQLYLATAKSIERRDLHTGAVQRFPIRWSHPLRTRYLTTFEELHPRWEISHLNLSPDQKTLIVLERLAGDPAG